MGDEGDLVEVRLARGCRCFGGWIDGELAGYGWLSTGSEWIGELELEIRPSVGEGYIWNCFTLADKRRRGVLRAVLTGYRWLQVRPAPGADPALVAAAHRVVGAPAGRFLRLSHPRRH